MICCKNPRSWWRRCGKDVAMSAAGGGRTRLSAGLSVGPKNSYQAGDGIRRRTRASRIFLAAQFSCCVSPSRHRQGRIISFSASANALWRIRRKYCPAGLNTPDAHAVVYNRSRYIYSDEEQKRFYEINSSGRKWATKTKTKYQQTVNALRI